MQCHARPVPCRPTPPYAAACRPRRPPGGRNPAPAVSRAEAGADPARARTCPAAGGPPGGDAGPASAYPAKVRVSVTVTVTVTVGRGAPPFPGAGGNDHGGLVEVGSGALQSPRT